MSLTRFLDRRDVTAKVKLFRPDEPRKLPVDLLVEPRSGRHGVVGTAFDYFLRFELQRMAPHATTSRWVPNASGAEIAAAVKGEYGHDVKPTLIYLVNSKAGVKASRKRRGVGKPKTKTTTAEWIDSIKLARKLIQSAGGVENAVAILRAVEG